MLDRARDLNLYNFDLIVTFFFLHLELSDNSNLRIRLFSAKLNILVPILSKTVPLRIRVKTLITVSFILYLSILLALFKKKVVPPLQANNTNRFHVFGTIFECFFKKVFSKPAFDF